MHASSQENMQKCYERYVQGEWSNGRGAIRVLDVGGADVNGSYADIFSEPQFEYVAADLCDGPGVQLVLEQPYELPCGDESFDLVISGQAFEHVEFFWELFREMGRVVKPDGFVFLIAPSAGPIHRYPVDCYRFYPDAYAALAKYARLQVIDCWLDDRGPWNDLVGVFSRSACPRPTAEELRGKLSSSGTNAYTRQRAPAPVTIDSRDDETENIRGEQPYREVLRAVHEALAPRSYLEIGVREGRSLALATCPSVGVDPQPGETALEIENSVIYRETSDFFFDFSAERALAGHPIDLAFIDGMHLFEFALRDFMNVEKRAAPSSIIVVDDIFPSHPIQASRSRQSRVWSGDVWKLYHCLMTHRPDLRLFPLDVAPAGLLIVGNLDPRNRTLWQEYNPLVRAYREKDICDYEGLILRREGAQSPLSGQVSSFLRSTRESRDSSPPAGAG